MSEATIKACALVLLAPAWPLSSCHKGDAARGTETPAAQANAQSAPAEAQVDPELQYQKQQVAEARAKCEAALQAIYARKKKAEPVLQRALKEAAEGSFYQAQTILDRANPILREQNRWKSELAKWRKKLHMLESSPYLAVSEDALEASAAIAQQVKRFEKGLPPGTPTPSESNRVPAAHQEDNK
jgi:cellobiose-specific phosphotransferase system component IIA